MDTLLKNNSFLNLLPASFYCKDKNGMYLTGNNYLKDRMQSRGIRINSLIGKSDYIAFPKAIADAIRDNDIETMAKKESTITLEKVVVQKNHELIFLSSKTPVFDENGDACGIIGTSIDMTAYHELLPSAIHTQNSLFPIENNSCNSNEIFQLSGKWQNTQFTFRQSQCAYLLCQGKTTNDIAKILGLSVRTAEDHIRQLKVKLNCIKKSTLIEILLTEVNMPDIINFIKHYNN